MAELSPADRHRRKLEMFAILYGARATPELRDQAIQYINGEAPSPYHDPELMVVLAARFRMLELAYDAKLREADRWLGNREPPKNRHDRLMEARAIRQSREGLVEDLGHTIQSCLNLAQRSINWLSRDWCSCDNCAQVIASYLADKPAGFVCEYCGFTGKPETISCQCYDENAWYCTPQAPGAGCPHGAITCPRCSDGEDTPWHAVDAVDRIFDLIWDLLQRLRTPPEIPPPWTPPESTAGPVSPSAASGS